MKKFIIAATSAALLLALPGLTQKKEKELKSPGAINLKKCVKEYRKNLAKTTRFTFKPGKTPSKKELTEMFKKIGKNRTKFQQNHLDELVELRNKYGTDPAINKIRMALAKHYLNIGKSKDGKNELAMMDPTNLTLKEKMEAIKYMNHFGMSSKATTMLIGLKVDKLNGRSRSLVITLLAVTGQKERALAALKKDELSDVIDAQDMWDIIQDMSKGYLSFGPDLARPLLAILYEEALRQYPDSPKARERMARLKALQLKSGSPALPIFGTNLEGKQTSLSGLKGKVVLLYFFGSYDDKFRSQLKQLNSLHKEFKDKGFEILGVSMDSPIATAKKAVEKFKIAWPVLCDGKGWKSEYMNQYAIYRTPFSMVIDKAGKVQGICVEGNHLKARIKELLK